MLRATGTAPDLLVGGDGDCREPLRGGHLRGGQQEPGLPDARFALQGDGGHALRAVAICSSST